MFNVETCWPEPCTKVFLQCWRPHVEDGDKSLLTSTAAAAAAKPSHV